ncbi:MAG: hypothetical protein NT003_02430 [Candidatus Magasanikbacteria bacterium]|nr:hypothetical protein [Candidatus Magasanikbacteria bacterium]
MKQIIQAFFKPVTHIILASFLLSLIFLTGTIKVSDDDVSYRAFAETLADQHKLDWTIPGFHGADFFVAAFYKITGSHNSVYIIDMLCAVLTIAAIYAAVSQIFNDKTLGVYAAYAFTLMPITYTSALRGFHFTPMIFFAFLGLYLLWYKPQFSFLIGISYIVKPFSIAFAPLFLYKKKMNQFFLSLLFPVLYVLSEFFQTHHIMIGAHKDYTPQSLFSLSRTFINIIYGIQNYFSIHGFSPRSFAYLDDMPHITPLITILAVFAIVYFQKFFKDSKQLGYTLTACAAIAFIIPASFYRFDYWYLTIFNFTLVLLALRPAQYYYKLLPIVVGTSVFEFYYTLLAHPQYFPTRLPKIALFGIWAIVLIISIAYTRIRSKSAYPNND